MLRPETARLTRSNLLPVGVTFGGTFGGGGFGAGMRVALAGKGGFDGPGTLFWAGAAGTVWVVDPVRRGNMVFMTQYMPAGAYPLMSDVLRAVEADLA